METKKRKLEVENAFAQKDAPVECYACGLCLFAGEVWVMIIAMALR